MPKFISLAKKKAEKSEQYFRHCCVVWKGGRIIGQAVNDSRSHAEVGVVSTLIPWGKADASDAECYRAKFLSIRITRTGRLAMAKPCAKCADLLRSYKMTGWYSTSDGRLEPWK